MNITQLKQWLFNNLLHGEQGGKYKVTADAVYSLILPDYTRVWGPDISHWDKNVQLSVTKERGASFVFIKAIDGTIQNAYFLPNRTRALGAGLLHAPYGWLYRNSNVSCVAQAQAYSNLVKQYPSALPPVLDFEWTKWGGQSADPNYDDLRKWAVEWLRLGNRKPLLYSAQGYMKTFGKIPADLKAMFVGIWIASPGTNNPSMPLGYASTEWLFHQFTFSGDAVELTPNNAGKLEVDLNYWKSDKQSLYDLAGVTQPNPDPVDPTPTGYQKVTRFGSDCYVVIADPKAYRVHVTNTNRILETVSSAAKRLSAFVAINGDGWTANKMPLSISASDGNLYQQVQYDFRPFINITNDKQIQIKWNDYNELFNTVSGTRFSIQNGTINPFLYDTSNAANVELHPRTAVGRDASGRLILVVVDGRSTFSAGVTLLNLAKIMQEFGAVDAIELDGGGSSTLWYNGSIRNVPSEGNERPVVNHLMLIGGTMPEPFYAEVTTPGLNLRKGVGTGFDIILTMVMGDKVKCSGVKNGTGIWWEIVEHNGVPVLGWASSGQSGEYMKVIEPPQTKTLTHTIKVYDDGSITVDA